MTSLSRGYIEEIVCLLGSWKNVEGRQKYIYLWTLVPLGDDHAGSDSRVHRHHHSHPHLSKCDHEQPGELLPKLAAIHGTHNELDAETCSNYRRASIQLASRKVCDYFRAHHLKDRPIEKSERNRRAQRATSTLAHIAVDAITKAPLQSISKSPFMEQTWCACTVSFVAGYM